MTSYEYWKQQKGFPGLGRKLKISILIPNYGGCSYYRLLLPSKKLVEHFPDVVEVYASENPLGWSKEKGPLDEKIDDKFFESDIIWTNNIPNYGINYLARVCGLTHQAKRLFHFDTDDLLTELYKGHRLEKVYNEQGLSENTKQIYYNSHLVTVTQIKFAERVKEFMGPHTLLAVIKNSIDYNLPCWSQSRVEVPKGRFTRVGWAGGIHHEEDVKEFKGIPWLVNSKVGKENVRWDFYGKPPVDPTSTEKWQIDVWKNYENILARGFQSYKNYTINSALNADQYGVMYANMDVAIAPLQMNAFNDSKCLKEGETVLMYDGTFKAVEHVQVGDLLIGPDSSPRTVQSLSSGEDEMAQIVPNRGEPFSVTLNHILTLKTNDKKLLKDKPQYINLTVKDYITSPKTFRYNYRLFKANNVSFHHSERQKLDPYFLGLLLGDGTLKGSPKITTMDKEIKDYFYDYCNQNYPELKIYEDHKDGNKASTYIASKIIRNNHVPNKLMLDIEALGLKNIVCGDKFIPYEYKTGLYDTRLAILAGLLDTDGSLQTNKTNYTFSNKSKKLVEDFIFVARSLGLYATPIKEFKVPSICDTTYYRTQLSGDTHLIPCKLPRKKALPRKVNRSALTSGFKINLIGKHKYYGFKLDKDGLFLLKDFTVTHNSEIKVAECGRYRVPLICSNVGCYGETIKNGVTGFLIDPGPKSAKQWVEVLTKVIKNRDLRLQMGENLHKVTEEYFNINKVVWNRLDYYKYYYENVVWKQSN